MNNINNKSLLASKNLNLDITRDILQFNMTTAASICEF